MPRARKRVELYGVQIKLCTYCHRWKLGTNFRQKTQLQDGLASTCKDCDVRAAQSKRAAVYRSRVQDKKRAARYTALMQVLKKDQILFRQVVAAAGQRYHSAYDFECARIDAHFEALRGAGLRSVDSRPRGDRGHFLTKNEVSDDSRMVG